MSEEDPIENFFGGGAVVFWDGDSLKVAFLNGHLRHGRGMQEHVDQSESDEPEDSRECRPRRKVERVPGWVTEDQALAQVYWGDDDSVASVGPSGNFTFRSLRRRREWRSPIDSRNRMEWRNMCGPVGKTADGQPIYASPPSEIVYRRLSVPPAPRPERIGMPADLYEACRVGELEAWGRRRDNGELEKIPDAEFVGGRPKGWDDIRISAFRFVDEPAQLSPQDSGVDAVPAHGDETAIVPILPPKAGIPIGGRETIEEDVANAPSKVDLREPTDHRLQEAITAVYAQAERNNEKPPNIVELRAPVQKELHKTGHYASGNRIMTLGRSFGRCRRKPGKTLASEKKRRFHEVDFQPSRLMKSVKSSNCQHDLAFGANVDGPNRGITMSSEIDGTERPLTDDLLRGISAIAKFLGETERRTYYLAENRYIPIGKVGITWIASKSALREHYERITRGAVEPQARMQPQPELRGRSRSRSRRSRFGRPITEMASA
jgi:hypothetical protein